MELSWRSSRPRLFAGRPLVRLAGPWLLLLVGIGVVAGIGSFLAGGPPLVEVSMSRLAGNPLPLNVIDGRLDGDFRPVRGSVIHQTQNRPGWWRVRIHGDAPAGLNPQLLLIAPRAASASAWHVSEAGRFTQWGSQRVSSVHSPRALMFPLDEGVYDGDTLYLQVHEAPGHPMRVRIDSGQVAERAGLVHVAWRSAGLAGLALLSLLAMGMWGAVREPLFGLLSLALVAQALYFSASGGEAGLWSTTAWLSQDVRVVHLLAVLALLGSVVFAAHYLQLDTRRPRIVKGLQVLGVTAGLLALLKLFVPYPWVVMATSALAAVMILGVLAVAVVDGMYGRRSAMYLLAGWVPMSVLLLGHLAELTGTWLAPPWLTYALPASCVLAGLVVTVGLGDVVRRLRRERDDASHRASYDALTGALSRAAIEARLAQAVRSAHTSGASLSVVFFDIDHFKEVNDEHGHLVGDECIRIVALRTRNRLRTYDLFGRWGGDEILVLLPDTALDEAVGVAENLRSAVNSRSLEIDGAMLDVTVSAGVAQLSYGEQANELVRRADAALYTSKQEGRDRVSASRWASMLGPSMEDRVSAAPAPATDPS